MDRDKAGQEDLPHRDDEQVEKHAQENRKRLDEVPPHGTDPLHEGP